MACRFTNAHAMAMHAVVFLLCTTALAHTSRMHQAESDGACSATSDMERQESTEYEAVKMELMQSQMKTSRISQKNKEDAKKTHDVAVLPSDWPDQDQLSALYHEILVDNEFSVPTQAQLTSVQYQNMAEHDGSHRGPTESAGNEYERWQPGEPWPQTYRMYTGKSGTKWTKNTLETMALFNEWGLDESSMVLEIGCGALRMGRIFIPLLARGHYHCIDPTRSLIQDGIKFELGYDLLQRKLPSFALNEEFRAPPGLSKGLVGSDAAATGESPTYTFMLAISIFTHTCDDLLSVAMNNLKHRFAPNTRLLATFHFAPCAENSVPSNSSSGWLYVEGNPKNIDENDAKWSCYDPDRLTEILQVDGLTWEYVGEQNPGSLQQHVVIYPQGSKLLWSHD